MGRGGEKKGITSFLSNLYPQLANNTHNTMPSKKPRNPIAFYASKVRIYMLTHVRLGKDSEAAQSNGSLAALLRSKSQADG